MLREWDQYDSADAAAPLVFRKWMKQLPIDMLSAAMPEDVYEASAGERDNYRRNVARRLCG